MAVSINYQKLIDESMLELVRKVLIHVQHMGLQDDHHFYISFYTNDPAVQLSEKMKKRYPQEITVVLQHQFDYLVVEASQFSVGMSFDGIHERIIVPFRAITGFVDPSVKFSVQFKHNRKIHTVNTDYMNSTQATIKQNMDNVITEHKVAADNIIVLDKFRNPKNT